MKMCKRCEVTQGLENFPIIKRNSLYNIYCRQCVKEKSRERRAMNRESYAEADRVKRNKNPFYYRFYNIQNRARIKGILFEITIEDLEEIWTGKCAALGIDILLNTLGKPFNEAQVDRIDNTRGYIKGNIAWISYRANRSKSDLSIDELSKIVRYMKENINE